jgi:hypothetical protein
MVQYAARASAGQVEGDRPESVIINRPAIPDIASVTRIILTASALLVRKTPPEVAAAGHDRCPINLTRQAAEEWLTPQGLTPEELLQILERRQVP